MRIVILADPLDNQSAGIHYYTRNLVKGLGEIDKSGEYYIIRRKKDKLFPAERQIIIKNYRFPGYAAWRMFVLIPYKLRKLKADVVVEPAHFGPFNLPRRMKRVTMIHDLTPILFPQYHRFHSQLLQRIFLKRILKRAKLILTNSDNTSRDLVAFLPASVNKTKRIYLGHDESIKKTVGTDVYKYNNGKPYFLYTGTIEPRKNLVILMKAYALFRDKSASEHQLLITGGKGWKSRDFYAELQKHPYKDDIVITGYVPREDLPALYSHAIAFVFPSLYEGFGLPVVEAMSCGTPCLLSNSSSLPEVGGDAALYFDPHNPAMLASLMQKVATNKELSETLSDKAIKQAEKFSWKKHVITFDKVIKDLD